MHLFCFFTGNVFILLSFSKLMTASREDKFVSKDEATYWPFAATTYRDLISSLLSPWDVSTPQVRRKEQLSFFALFFQVKINLSCELEGLKSSVCKLQLLLLRKASEFLEWFGLPPIIRLVCFLTRKAARRVMVCS